MTSWRRDFILRNTRLRCPPAVPEVHLYLAEEIIPLWKTLDALRDKGTTPPPYWAFAWAGGQALARYLLDSPHEVRGKRVLDFAAGSGICAIAALKAGAAQVTAVDIDAFSLEAISLNAVANAVPVGTCGDDVLQGQPPEFDVIVAGDVCYEEPMATSTLTWLLRAARCGTRVLVGDPGRAHFRAADLDLLHEYVVTTSRDLEDAERKRTGVYAFRET